MFSSAFALLCSALLSCLPPAGKPIEVKAPGVPGGKVVLVDREQLRLRGCDVKHVVVPPSVPKDQPPK